MKPFKNWNRKGTGTYVAICAALFTIGIVLWGFWPNSDVGNVKVVFSHFENVPGGRVAVFKVSNAGTGSVTLFGYKKMWPNYLVGWYDGTNWDLDYSPGNEFRLNGPIFLPRGAELAMPTFLPPVERWVVGVQCSAANYTRILPTWLRRFEAVENFVKRRMKISWSDPITRHSEPSNVIPPLGAKTNLIAVRTKDEFDDHRLNTGGPR